MTSHLIVCAIVLAVVLAAFVTPSFAADPSTQPSTQPSPREGLKLFLLIGQSNMSGRGTVDEESKKADPRVLTFTKDQTWAPATDPIAFDKSSAGVGPGVAFGKALAAKHPDFTIGLIPCAVGGTRLQRWEKDADLYKAAVARCKEAMKSGTLCGILWHQGESDADNEKRASTYGDRLTKMFADLRAELGAGDVPIVVAPLGEWFQFPFAAKVNSALTGLPSVVPSCACISNEGIGHNGDSVHFNTAGARELGKRYAEAMDKLLK